MTVWRDGWGQHFRGHTNMSRLVIKQIHQSSPQSIPAHKKNHSLRRDASVTKFQRHLCSQMEIIQWAADRNGSQHFKIHTLMEHLEKRIRMDKFMTWKLREKGTLCNRFKRQHYATIYIKSLGSVQIFNVFERSLSCSLCLHLKKL